MGPRSTVFDRSKKSGFMTGSNHVMAPAFADSSAPAPPDSVDASQEPPNLRDAAVTPDSCGTCNNYSAGRCDLYSTGVTPNQVCDSFEGREDEPDAAMPSPEPGQEMMA